MSGEPTIAPEPIRSAWQNIPSARAPGMIAKIHGEYAAAGAEIPGTNTFGANQTRSAGFGLADKTVAINQVGVAPGH
jgi:methionine synthase I (cobalamin-dependent)